MILGVLGTNEILIIGALVIVGIVVIFIYKYGKQKGRLKELDRQLKEKNKD
jgi:hypothetical protein